MRLTIFAGALVALLAATPSFALTASRPHADAREVLPATVIPSRYELALHPEPEQMRFHAEVKIAVTAHAATPAIVLNAKGLVFDHAVLEDGRSASVTLDPKLERATLAFPGGVAAGAHTLTIAYHGEILRNTLGFFAMNYATAAGPRQVLATNFEPSAERQLMPSWDEPGRKAVFQVTVDAPADRMAISNMPVASETPIGNGQKRVSFQPTPPMSTYLLFVGIGDYERITDVVDGVTVGVVVPRGATERGRYALSQATRLLHYYDDWFGVRFPLPKLDLVAAPGAIEGGSMENWGSIFYGQEHLLFDPHSGTEADRQLVFLVVAHEMAHQWFGDLVTMAWWDNLWLNEGFARWMQTKAADDLHPEWNTGLQALAIYDSGMRADAAPSTHPVEQPVNSPAEAELAFDHITYDKGAAVIHMIEGYVGPDPFRDGVRRYMHAHALGNTVSRDLWSALQSQAGKPVGGLADAFTRRAGLPLLSVAAETAHAGGAALELSQGRFEDAHATAAPVEAARPWPLPTGLQSAAGGPISALPLAASRTTLPAAGPLPVIANAGRTSYARVLYAPKVFAAVAQHYASLRPADQIGMMQDALALAEAGYAPVSEVMDLAAATPGAAEPLVWARTVRTLAALDGLYAGNPGQTRFRTWARATLQPVLARVGWDGKAGESQDTALLRQSLLLSLSRFDDAAVIAEARRRFASPDGQPPEVRRVALSIVARHADGAAFDRLLDRLHAESDPLEKQHLMEALTAVADPALAERLLARLTTPDTAAGTAPGILLQTAAEHPDLAWRWLVANLANPELPLDRSTQITTIAGVAAESADPARIEALRALAQKSLPPEAKRPVADAVGSIRTNVRMRNEGRADLDRWLAAHAAG